MVNFENETTIGTPAIDIVRVLILQRRADLFESWENYNKKSNDGVEVGLSIVRARLTSLFLELQPGLKRRYKPEDYKELLKTLKSEDEKEIEELIYKLNEELDTIRLIRIDNKKQYNRTIAENENAEHGI